MSPTKKNTSLTKLIAESKGRPLEILIQVLKKKKIKQKFCLHIAEANLKTNDIVKKKKLRLQLMVLTMTRKRSDASSVHDAEQKTSGGPHA